MSRTVNQAISEIEPRLPHFGDPPPVEPSPQSLYDWTNQHLFERFKAFRKPGGRAATLCARTMDEVAFLSSHFDEALLLNPDSPLVSRLLQEGAPDKTQIGYVLPEQIGRFGPLDAVFSLYSLNHYRDPVAVLRCVRDSLTPGGLVFIAVPNAAMASRRLAQALGYIGALDELTPQMKRWGQKRYLSFETLRPMIQAAGLREIGAGGAFLKTLTEAQTKALQSQGLIGDAYLRALVPLGEACPDLSATIYLVAERAG